MLAKARFIEPMLLLRTEKVPEGADWLTELKLDGYRTLAIKTGGKLQVRSRNYNDFNSRYSGIAKALAAMPDDTVIDGEVVALDAEGRPSFNMLQHYGSACAPLHFFIDLVRSVKAQGLEGLVAKRRDSKYEPGLRSGLSRK